MPRNGIAESYGNCMCKFLRNCFPQWLHHLDSYEEYFKLMNTLICAFGGNKQSSMLRSTQGLNCWVLLCSDVELWLNAASFPEPAVRQLCEVLAVRSSLVLAVLAVLSISLLLNAASLRIKIPPHPTFKASASWAYAPQGRATLCCWPSPGVELAQAWCGAGPCPSCLDLLVDGGSRASRPQVPPCSARSGQKWLPSLSTPHSVSPAPWVASLLPSPLGYDTRAKTV